MWSNEKIADLLSDWTKILKGEKTPEAPPGEKSAWPLAGKMRRGWKTKAKAKPPKSVKPQLTVNITKKSIAPHSATASDLNVNSMKTCQWMEGHHRDRAFCGRPNVHGTSYCEEHYGICYIKSKSKQGKQAAKETA